MQHLPNDIGKMVGAALAKGFSLRGAVVGTAHNGFGSTIIYFRPIFLFSAIHRS